MANGLIILIHIQMLGKLLSRNPEPLFHKAADKVAAHMQTVNDDINFRSVAGCYNDAFQYTLGAFQLLQRLRQIPFGKSKTFSDFHRRCSIVQPDYDDVHCKFTCLIKMSYHHPKTNYVNYITRIADYLIV
ncbi:hypothetical protein D3C77_242640 [compost metagenome]